jgi:succinate dehydrogenase/fumarate reductase flavoprotein subunit
MNLLLHTCRNGARVNTKSQVIAALKPGDVREIPASIDDEKVIPHLYAAGELGNTHSNRRGHGSLGNFATFARIAGENAAKETPIS